MLKKYLGIFFLLSGLALIFFSLYFSYNIFMGKQQAPRIFKIENQQNIPKTNSQNPVSVQEQINNIVSEKIKEIFPQEYINNLLNLLSWSIFAWILITTGSVISGIGIKLLK